MQFFTAAVRKRLLGSNPFSDLKATGQPNPERFHFVSQHEAALVLNACKDVEYLVSSQIAQTAIDGETALYFSR